MTEPATQLKILDIELPLGIEKPFTVMHISDSHVALTDHRDDPRKQELGAQRRAAFDDFPDSARIFLEQAMAYGRANCDLIVHTGDLIDFVSIPNLEFFATVQREEKIFFAPGNHEFSLYVGEAFEDTAYKMRSFARIRSRAHNDPDFAARVVNGVNFVAVDNSYYLFADRHLTRLQQELDRGLPVILCMHNPLYTADVARALQAEKPGGVLYLVDTPPEILATYSDFRRRQQTPDEATRRFVDLCRRETRIKAIFAGHLHQHFRTCFNGTIPQFTAPAAYGGAACVFHIS